MIDARVRAGLAALMVAAVGFVASCAAPWAEDDDYSTSDEVMTADIGGSVAPAAERRRWRRRGTTPPPVETPEPETPPVAPPSSPSVRLPYRGTNLSGAEFGGALPGTQGIDYTWPTNAEVDYFVAKGMNTFRINFRWERLQSSTYADFVAAYAAKLDAIVSYVTSKRATVLLNPQNFARYYETTVGSPSVPASAFADLWRRLAVRYQSNPRVMFGLVNEPHDMATEQWVESANAAIAAIRATGAKNTITVPGNAWTGAHSWSQTWYGTSNAVAMKRIVDPGDNILFEAHQYLDTSAGGHDGSCVSKTAGRERLAPFIAWLRANGKKGIIAELAGGNNATCNAAIEDMMNAMEEASDVLQGWLWWAAGPWWGDYPFSIEPRSGGGDAPQMRLLAPRLAGLPLF